MSEVLRKGAKVLDMGCGPGAWSMEIASEYPKSQVVGVDISPMFPNDIKPSNCTFHQLDLHQGLPFEDGTFDYVFMRYVVYILFQMGMIHACGILGSLAWVSKPSNGNLH